jgi:hypothetical protein
MPTKTVRSTENESTKALTRTLARRRAIESAQREIHHRRHHGMAAWKAGGVDLGAVRNEVGPGPVEACLDEAAEHDPTRDGQNDIEGCPLLARKQQIAGGHNGQEREDTDPAKGREVTHHLLQPGRAAWPEMVIRITQGEQQGSIQRFRSALNNLTGQFDEAPHEAREQEADDQNRSFEAADMADCGAEQGDLVRSRLNRFWLAQFHGPVVVMGAWDETIS